VSGDYYALLGARPDASPAELRRAYEIAVRQASRDGAVKHMADLVRAYEVLSDPGRRRLYDGTGRAVIPERTPNTHGRAVPWRGGQPALGQNTVRRARHAPAPTVIPRSPSQLSVGRVLKTALTLTGLAAGGLVAAVVLTNPQPRSQQEPPPRAHVVVPATAHVGQDGRVLVTCDGTPAGAGYRMRVPRGAAVYCANGAYPRW
jgi:curved DNA-binding protein CbpA